MYSNLRTEGSRSNHLIVPASAQVFDFQRDLVLVTSSSDTYLQSLASKHQLIPYFEVRRRPTAAISYARGRVQNSFPRVSDDPAFTGVIPYMLTKIMRFRPVGQGQSQRCWN
jgi:hypothetical protein